MKSHRRAGSRAVVFMVDIAGSSTPKGARNARDVAFRRQVAREHSVMVLSTIERILCFADELCKFGVAWTYQIFDSRGSSHPTPSTVVNLSSPSSASMDECRKAVQLRFDSACKKIDTRECSLDVIGATLNYLLNAAPSLQPFEPYITEKGNGNPLIVLLTPASYTRCSLHSLSNRELENVEAARVFNALNECSMVNSALKKLDETDTALLWVSSYSRRIENMTVFNSELDSLFKKWLMQKKSVVSLTDMHSLLLDRNLVPFHTVARHIFNPNSHSSVPTNHESAETSRFWLPVDFILPPLNGLTAIPCSSERLLKVEMCNIVLNNSHANRLWAVCEALVKYSTSDSDLTALGCFDVAPGLIRPVAGKIPVTSVSPETQPTWMDTFSGLMVALAHTGHFLLVSMYSSGTVSNVVEYSHSVIVQPLTPLCGILRPISPSILNKAKIEPLLPSSCQVIGENPLRKRIFGGPWELHRDLIDSIGDSSGGSQSARFFEAHLFPAIDFHENSSSSSLHSGNILTNLTRTTSPRLISELLEGYLENFLTKNLDEFGSAITEHHAKGVIQDYRSSFTSQDNGHDLMESLVKRLGECSQSPEPCSKESGHYSEAVTESKDFRNEMNTVTLGQDAGALLPSLTNLQEVVEEEKRESLGTEHTFPDVVHRIDADVGRILTADTGGLRNHCSIALQSIAEVVDLGTKCDFSFTSDIEFARRIQKFKQIQKKMSQEQGKAVDSDGNLHNARFAQCVRCYEQAVLHMTKEIVRYRDNKFTKANMNSVDTLAKQKRAIEKRLKRVSKILNVVLAVAVSQDRYITDGNPFHELFDEFFKVVVSRLILCGEQTAAGVLGKAVAVEFERFCEPEQPGDVVGPFQASTDERTPSSSINDVLPPLQKRSRPKDICRRDARDRKRPRTKELKRVLAEATAMRAQAAPVRRDPLQGFRNLEFEKGIQLPMQIKAKSSPADRVLSQSSDLLLMQFNLGRRRKQTLASGHVTSEDKDDLPKGLNRRSFYSESLTIPDLSASNQSNPVLVPGTPSDTD